MSGETARRLSGQSNSLRKGVYVKPPVKVEKTEGDTQGNRSILDIVIEPSKNNGKVLKCESCYDYIDNMKEDSEENSIDIPVIMPSSSGKLELK